MIIWDAVLVLVGLVLMFVDRSSWPFAAVIIVLAPAAIRVFAATNASAADLFRVGDRPIRSMVTWLTFTLGVGLMAGVFVIGCGEALAYDGLGGGAVSIGIGCLAALVFLLWSHGRTGPIDDRLRERRDRQRAAKTVADEAAAD